MTACGILLFNQQKHYITSTTLPMVIKIGSMVTNFEGLLPIKSHESLITRFYKIT